MTKRPNDASWDLEGFEKIYVVDTSLVDKPSEFTSVHRLAEKRKPSTAIFADEDLAVIEAHFHDLIRYRNKNAPSVLVWLDGQELPKITNDMLNENEPRWFQVAGMYGGFNYALFDHNEPTLITESFIRVVGGSGEQHCITVDEVMLNAEGFC